MNRLFSLIAAFACLAIGGWALTSQTQGPADPFGAAFAQSAAEVDTSMVQDMVLGNPDSSVTVVEYASFTCPHCAAFHAENFKKLKADFIDTGKIKFVYRDVYFDRPGLWAAMVARCGEGAENRFFGIAEMLYQKQRDWVTQDSPQLIVDRLKAIGKTAGLTDADLDACLQDGKTAEGLYGYYVKNRDADGIDSTPSFVINGKKYTNMPYEQMKEILDAALAG